MALHRIVPTHQPVRYRPGCKTRYGAGGWPLRRRDLPPLVIPTLQVRFLPLVGGSPFGIHEYKNPSRDFLKNNCVCRTGERRGTSVASPAAAR